jgi:hypothetical protein
MSPIRAERFQKDLLELYEEPTIAEMEEIINDQRLEGEENMSVLQSASEDGSFEFEERDDVEAGNQDSAKEPPRKRPKKSKK